MKPIIVAYPVAVFMMFSSCSKKEIQQKQKKEQNSVIVNPDKEQLSEISDSQFTQINLEKTIIESYSVDNVKLIDAAKKLTELSEKIAVETNGITIPIIFQVEDVVHNKRVTLTTKNTSFNMIAKILAEQSNVDVVVGDKKVLFSAGVWDMMGGESSDDEPINLLPPLTE